MGVERLQALMVRDGVDVVIAASPESTLYLSGAFILTQELIRERVGIVVVPREGEPVFITSRMEEVLARRLASLGNIQTYTYVEFGDPAAADAPIPLAVEQVKAWGLQTGVVAVEKGFLPVELYDILRRQLPDARLVDGGGLLSEARWIKSAAEIDHLATAARATQAAIQEAFSVAEVGWSEKQVANRIAAKMLANGADMVSYVFLGSGGCGSMSHWVPGPAPIREGEVLRVDAMGRFGGYCSDFARTAVAGRPSAEQSRIYRSIAIGQRRLLETVRPGLPLPDLYHAAGRYLEEAGLPFRSLHIGHGIGTQLHERPMIAPFAGEVLQENMVLNVEIFYRQGIDAGYHLEDLVRVTADGAQVLTEPVMDEELPTLGRALATAGQ